MAKRNVPVVDRQAVVRLWLFQQGLLHPLVRSLDRDAFTGHLERTGGLQLDTINVVDRAHYLTLWSRFGPYDRADLDRWIYRERRAYEYWGHQASILPISHLPLGRRRMRDFPPATWTTRAWWPLYNTGTASRRRVLRRLRAEGPLESADFEVQPEEDLGEGRPGGGGMPLPKEDGRSLKLLWHAGKAAVTERRSFRCVYDLAERVYPPGPVASRVELEDSWLEIGLEGNGVASEAHLAGYFTAPELRAADRKRILTRNLKRERIREVRVEGVRGPCYASPAHLDSLGSLEDPSGTTLLCPFDSFLWQRKRAEELLGFEYRVEIYVPAAQRQHGYYVMPILHRGQPVGRVDPKLHREQALLEIRSLTLEPSVRADRSLLAGLRDALHSLARFGGATDVVVPAPWRRRLA